jgi:HAD superfamily hydrolase (TIGR01509 family)
MNEVKKNGTGKLIIFDMDGVLTDSEPATIYASIQSLAEYGVTAKPADFKPFTGMGDDIFIGKVAEKYGAAYVTQMKQRMYEIYTETAAEKVRVYNWSRSILLKLKEYGYKLAVASASDYVKVHCNIGCIGVDINIFDAVVTGSDVKNKKPSPDIFLKAAEKAGYVIGNASGISNAVVVEDALSGVKAAKAAGATAVAVTTSFTAEELRSAGADYIFDDLNEIGSVIQGILPID